MTIRRHWFLLIGLMTALFWLGPQPTRAPAAPQGGQQSSETSPPTAPGVIRTEANLVIVDVIAVDKKDKYVRDLEMNEFHVFEDDKEQPITAFSRSTEVKASPERPRYLVLRRR